MKVDLNQNERMPEHLQQRANKQLHCIELLLEVSKLTHKRLRNLETMIVAVMLSIVFAALLPFVIRLFT